MSKFKTQELFLADPPGMKKWMYTTRHLMVKNMRCLVDS